MAIEIIPKPSIKKSYLGEIIFYILIILSFIFLFICLGLFFYNKKLEQKKAELVKQIESALTEVYEKKIKDLQTKLTDFGQILLSHKFPSNIFYYLERATIPQVFYNDFKLDVPTNSLLLSGTTDSFASLGQQLAILENQNFIKKVELKKISLAREGGVNFEFQITINAEIFNSIKEPEEIP